MPLPDMTFLTNDLVGVRKEFDYLEVALKPEDGTNTVTWMRVPLMTEFGALAEDNSDTSLPTFVDSAGKSVTLKARQYNGATVPFTTAAHFTHAVPRALLRAARKGTPALFRGYYLSQGLVAQGNCVIGSRGQQGGTTDIPQFGFDLLISTYGYYLPDGTPIDT